MSNKINTELEENKFEYEQEDLTDEDAYKEQRDGAFARNFPKYIKSMRNPQTTQDQNINNLITVLSGKEL